ncbi:DUF5999 family protein [Streptomyces sp. NPDC088768]|uniref:DUF5999 family protein n=1 Tax=Streptomyces sp. NPDC088768 TaxID=3365894 RepID=UPI003822C12D
MDCPHTPPCPSPYAPDCMAAEAENDQRSLEQGWLRLCNGVVVFGDTGALLPDGSVCAPHRATSGAARSGRTS